MEHYSKKSVALAIALVVAGGAAFMYYYPPRPSADTGLNIQDIQAVAANDSIYVDIETTEAFQNIQGNDTGTKYKYLSEELVKMQEDLRNSSTADSEIETLFKKAVYYKKLASAAFVQDAAQRDAMVVEAYNGLYEGLEGMAAAAEREKFNPRYLRRLYLYVINYIYSADPDLFLKSRFGSEPYMQSLLQQFPADQRVASAIYVNDKLFSVNDLPRDNYMVSIKMLNLAKLLSRPGVVDNTALKNKIANESQMLMVIFPTASTTQLTNSEKENIVRPLVDRALAYGLFARYGLVSDQTASEAFDDAYNAIQKNVTSPDDNLWFSEFMLDVNFASFLYQTRDRLVTTEVAAKLREIEGFENRFKDNPELISLSRRYLIRATGPLVMDPARLDMIEIGRKESAFGNYLVRIGVKM